MSASAAAIARCGCTGGTSATDLSGVAGGSRPTTLGTTCVSPWWQCAAPAPLTPSCRVVRAQEFFLHARGDAVSTPVHAPVGAWRSPMVEQQQLKRNLSVGFEAISDGAEGVLGACGADAATPFIPDGICRVRLSTMRFHPEGLNHGKTAYLARDWEAVAVDEEAATAGKARAAPRPCTLLRTLSASSHLTCTRPNPIPGGALDAPCPVRGGGRGRGRGVHDCNHATRLALSFLGPQRGSPLVVDKWAHSPSHPERHYSCSTPVLHPTPK